MTWVVVFRGLFGIEVRREFQTRRGAESWAWRIGRPDLLRRIVREVSA